jgi:emfourin
MAFKLSFRQSGGIGGLIRGCDLDSATLDATEANELSALLSQSGLDALRASQRPHPDAIEYWISITDEAGTRERVFGGADMTPQLRPLLRYLQSRSHPCPP